MAMIIEVKGFNKDVEWHVGEDLPSVNPESVRSIQADGHELEAILNQIRNLPHGKRRVQTWRGEFAILIFDHLKA